MLHTTPTYALRSEAILVVSEPLLYAIGGGNASGLISSDYSDFYSLLWALCASVRSRLFRVYIFLQKIIS